MQEMVIYGVSFDMVGKQPIVLLKTADGNKFLPIWIGHPEAAAILMKLQGAATPRPMTHDLFTDMLAQLEAQVVKIAVTELRDNTFYALITVAVERHRDRDRLAAERRDRPRGPRRRADLRRGRGDRGERDRVRARGRERGGDRRGVQEVPRRGQARGLLHGLAGCGQGSTSRLVSASRSPKSSRRPVLGERAGVLRRRAARAGAPRAPGRRSPSRARACARAARATSSMRSFTAARIARSRSVIRPRSSPTTGSCSGSLGRTAPRIGRHARPRA